MAPLGDPLPNPASLTPASTTPPVPTAPDDALPQVPVASKFAAALEHFDATDADYELVREKVKNKVLVFLGQIATDLDPFVRTAETAVATAAGAAAAPFVGPFAPEVAILVRILEDVGVNYFEARAKAAGQAPAPAPGSYDRRTGAPKLPAPGLN